MVRPKDHTELYHFNTKALRRNNQKLL